MNLRVIKNTLKDFFNFSRTERNGILILLFCILMTNIFRWVYPFHAKQGRPLADNSYKADVNRLKSQGAQKDTYTQSSKRYDKSTYATAQIRQPKIKARPKEVKMVEINSSDSVRLDELPGIGAVYARRIIKYRERLGGYYHKDQILEVYGMKPEFFNLFAKYIWVDTLLLRKLDLNTATFKEINAHPYISYEQTKEIFHFRNKKITINLDLLRKNAVFDSLEIKKIKPYLFF